MGSTPLVGFPPFFPFFFSGGRKIGKIVGENRDKKREKFSVYQAKRNPVLFRGSSVGYGLFSLYEIF